MRFPWSKKPASGPGRNTDGGQKSALFSFDRDRERQMAERYSRGRQDWIDARYRLIDEVLEYRRTGQLTPSLLEACEAEFEVAAWAYSVGVRRLVELAHDGHADAAERVESLMSSKDWRVRYEALVTSFKLTVDDADRRALVRRALADRSARIRAKLADDAAFEHLIDMVEDLEAAAAREPREDEAKAIFWAAWEMRRNEKSGRRRRLGGGDDEVAAQYDADWSRFRPSCAFTQP